MADSFWVWSHGFKVREPKDANPAARRYTLEYLDALTDMEHIGAFIGRWKDDEDKENFSAERMAYIIKHGLKYERVLIGHPFKRFDGSDHMFKVQYMRVLLDASRAVEFKIRFYNFSLDEYL